MIKNESLAKKLRIIFDASTHERTALEKKMILGKERCKIMQEQKQVKSERAKMLSVDPDAVVQPVAIGEEKDLSRDSFNVPIISADEEMYKEKEETSVNVIKDKAKEDVYPVCVNSNLKASSNVLLVPHHSCFNRKNSLDKRGVEKHALELHDFIKRFGIMTRRQALRERTNTTKAELRKRVRLKLRLSEYSQKLQNSVFKRRVQPEVTIMEICVVKEKRSLCGTKRNRVKRAQQRPLPWTASGEKLRGEIGTLNGKLPKSFIPQGENSCRYRECPPPLQHQLKHKGNRTFPPPQTNTLEEEPRSLDNLKPHPRSSSQPFKSMTANSAAYHSTYVSPLKPLRATPNSPPADSSNSASHLYPIRRPSKQSVLNSSPSKRPPKNVNNSSISR
ncbi:dual specificity protein phosphatase CDC14A [Trichonephila clavata]|uniref:Dual specificity protein phosphatase CDC14A n=1 Tax=Trichonephila clavata TaxID=2740835 RepID=A0A8X6J1S2_TRICU|nr:dual specificity protein phosphatase CDC14A [Trichonephila clavata]